MRKISFLNLLVLMFFTFGCRSDFMTERDSGKTIKNFTYKQISKEEIPKIMDFLSAKTDNFKLHLKTSNALGKTEIVFGEIDTIRYSGIRR